MAEEVDGEDEGRIARLSPDGTVIDIPTIPTPAMFLLSFLLSAMPSPRRACAVPGLLRMGLGVGL
jgi:hypothetical protein